MIFSGSITVPAGRTKTAPKIERLKITKGVITQINLIFPPGCAHEVFITINRALHQIYPTNPDGYFIGDGVNFTGTVFHYVKAQPFEVQIYGWSPNASYDHTIHYYMWIKKAWQLNPLSDEFWHMTLEDSVEGL